jgi:hypothetical protein
LVDYFGHARKAADVLTALFADALSLPRGFFEQARGRAQQAFSGKPLSGI